MKGAISRRSSAVFFTIFLSRPARWHRICQDHNILALLSAVSFLLRVFSAGSCPWLLSNMRGKEQRAALQLTAGVEASEHEGTRTRLK
jgi:hypothetical protein